MKQLVRFRGEFADAQLAYLRALKNTGVTLRQFTESEFLELENSPVNLALPPSPPPSLPPSPPPPPPFSPDLRNFEHNKKAEAAQEEIIEIDDDKSCTPPPPPAPNTSWDFWDPFGSPPQQKKSEVVQVEEENWAETKTEFEEEDQEEEVCADYVVNSHPEKASAVELVDDNSSMVSWHTKDTADMTMVVWGTRKTLAGIIKELDDYFLKASDGGKEIAVLMDITGGDAFLHRSLKENKRKRCNSAKVFSALSWTWSSKSLQFTRDAIDHGDPSEPCRPGAHCVTLEKLYAEEQKLYKEVKEEENAKSEYDKKSFLLQKQEDENYDWTKTEKTRSSVESLQSDIISLQQSISQTSSSILKLMDDELYPQLIAITSGMMHMWRRMYECHHVQNHISLQLNNLSNHQNMDPTTEYHRQATAQLETEVSFWHNSFCKLIKSQQQYINALCRWAQLTKCLADDHQRNCCSSAVCTLCEEWQVALDRLPHKVTSEAIKSLLSAVQSIVLQQLDEYNLEKKCDKLEKKLQKELDSLAEMEIKLEGNSTAGDTGPSLSPRHPLSVKRTKTEALKKLLNGEKSKYLNSIQLSRTMTLNNLQTSLPNVFQALKGFSSACTQALEAVHWQTNPEACHDDDGLHIPVA
ncbi:protein ALTERED PHOSPHATE STARVATION RESPONSE 1 isoform X2 [Malania oleifera]|nr:protein ALTERED PHOSPHATE STARVATION RESPONSE 1 isoform X2 [Malania oleifera]